MRRSGPGVLCASVARFFLVFSTLICPASGFAQVKIRAAYGTPSLSQVVFPLGVQAGMFERTRYLLTSNSLVLLRGKALTLSVYTQYDDPADLEWIRSTTNRWIDDLKRLNAR